MSWTTSTPTASRPASDADSFASSRVLTAKTVLANENANPRIAAVPTSRPAAGAKPSAPKASSNPPTAAVVATACTEAVAQTRGRSRARGFSFNPMPNSSSNTPISAIDSMASVDS